MGLSFHWLGLAALSCLLSGAEVWGDCTEDRIEMEGGNYTLTQGLNTTSILIYICPEGFYPYPKMTRTCLRNGRWDPSPRRYPPQRCKLVECPDPNVLESGHVSPPQEKYFVGNETTYECYSGYKMRGSRRRVCLPNGKWSGYTPICSRESGHSCADPGIPPGASRTGSGLEFDDVVRYSCNGNLFLVGSSTRKCQENSQWTGTEPACYYKYTYDTSLEVSQAFGGSIKDTLTTLQSTDDTQEGRKIRISKNGTLNIYIAVDISESIEKKHLTNAKKAITTLITKISSFSVTPNYEIVFFSSQVYEVVSILDFLDGTVELNTVTDRINNFNIKKNTAGTNLNAVFRFFLERMALIKRQVGDESFKEHRHVLILFTDGAYNMGGSPLPSVERIKTMVYMNQTRNPENELREEYLDIYIFAIGTTIFDSDLRPLTVGTDGRHYFRMTDIQNLQETFDEIIDEEEVKGSCGLHRDYATSGDDLERKKYPWHALINVDNIKSTSCIGSLVTPRFVLTAAHCFKFGDLPEHVKILLDDGNGREKRVEKFTLHPRYKINAKENEGVKEFYDYDVALIQLKEDVVISFLARPICIPCTQETSNAMKLVGQSTCQQQEEILLTNDIERLSFLTRIQKSLKVKEKDVHAKLGNNRDECIRHALEAPGITTTNPKDAVTDNFLCTGGLHPYTDHIACQGDSGGAVFKNYEQRTVQVALVSWGSKNLCSSRRHMVDSTATSRDFHINLFRMMPFLKSILGNDTQDVYAPLLFLEE